MSYIYLFYSKHLIKKIRAIITLFILFLALFSPNVLAAKSSDESVSLDERIIKQFSVAGIKLGMGEEEAAQKLKQLANKTGGVFLIDGFLK